ncbi:smad nuclear-interacting protein 1 [Thrips palmi]|uniref:Smad nuclear-interacting protein 1 n=1 Tax=Thrips palmi TaxID=161013 RepID=A0A6P9A6N2_THRPL|nr:smad nuclear-interacting protein 1 [Thrips palmi]
MKEHGHKKHRRGSRDRYIEDDVPSKVPKREPGSPSELREDQDRHRRKPDHHDRHRHSMEDPNKSSRNRDDRDRDRDNNRDRDHTRDRDHNRDRDRHRDRKHEGNVKIKDEPLDSDDAQGREGPSRSKWDDEEERNRNRGLGRGSGRNSEERDSRGTRGFRPDFHENRGGRGRGRGRGGRGGRGGHSRFPKSEEDTSNYEWGKKTEDGGNKPLPPEERDKPNFGLSGKLTEDTNTYKGVVIKYSEPPEARVPKRRWRLYPFKGEEALKVLYIHRASAFLLGRERKVVDIPLDHPSCSKQHAALQFRLVQFDRDNGTVGKRIRPYIIDLDSANGTFVNNNKIDPRKYVELLERDVLKFGYSSREYVLLHEQSKDEDEDDNME